MGDAMRGFRFTFLGLTAGAALALAATGASAEGLGDRGSVKSGPYAAPLSWTGFYVGAAVAYGSGTTEVDDAFDVGLRGAQGAVSVGYDYRLNPRWVVGVFGDYAFGEIDGTFESDLTFAIDQQWAIGGRLGLLATPSTLFYASAGYTRADFELSVLGIAIDETLDGFFVGVGVEQAIDRNLTLKLDYRFSDYQDFTDVTFIETNFDSEVHSIRLSVNWKFGRDEVTQLK